MAASGDEHPPVPARAGPHLVRLVASATPLTRPIAANAGLDAASGDWITFLDDDDRFLPGHIAGLVQAAERHGATVVHSFARAVFADGRVERVGRPFCLIQRYEHNYIQVSTTIVARELVAAGCRFDESLPILEDWDFFLQLAQRTPFHFVPLQSFEWHADTGTPGACVGANKDEVLFAAMRDRVHKKWRVEHEALIDEVRLALARASAAAAAGAFEPAAAYCHDALRRSPNDPHILSFLAMLAKRTGQLDDALRLQQAAVSVRPDDADLHLNLASILLALGRRDATRVALSNALRCDLTHVHAKSRLAALDVTQAPG